MILIVARTDGVIFTTTPPTKGNRAAAHCSVILRFLEILQIIDRLAHPEPWEPRRRRRHRVRKRTPINSLQADRSRLGKFDRFLETFFLRRADRGQWYLHAGRTRAGRATLRRRATQRKGRRIARQNLLKQGPPPRKSLTCITSMISSANNSQFKTCSPSVNAMWIEKRKVNRSNGTRDENIACVGEKSE